MHTVFLLLSIVVVTALLFDFVNGFNDAANTISTIVVTRTLPPIVAVMMAGFGNFTGLCFGTAVAKTVGKGVVDTHWIIAMGAGSGINELLLHVLICALFGAILWNLLAWSLGIPTSSSHALIGGLIGSALACAASFQGMSGLHVVNWGDGSWKDLGSIFAHGEFYRLNEAFGVKTIFAFIIIAPLFGFLVAAVFKGLALWICRNMHPHKAERGFRILQVLSAVFASIAHGTNDAQKTMGVIAMAMIAAHAYASDTSVVLTMDNVLDVHRWIAIACYSAISLGTMCGGWRIVKTMGTQITKIHPLEGCTSGTAVAMVIAACTHLGIPVSTTHVVAGSIMGVGSVRGFNNVRWVTARKIVWAWVITIPATATMASLCYLLIFRGFRLSCG
ncbi:MAG TPA: inorganic phosphate transporter [Fibrobacteraceae bacterium]|nr:inorganic phosphate transporter [Fibrobacteraceae bacterium]